MRTVPGPSARTRAAGALGLAVAVTLGGCSSTPSSTSEESSAPPSTAAASPSASRTPTPSQTPGVSEPAIPRYVDKIPADVRRALFTQGSVPASYADWISTSPRQTNVNGSIEMKVDRRLPPCTKDPATHFGLDQHTAGFAADLLQAGHFIVARQLTVYHDADQAEQAVQEMVHKNTGCDSYDGKAVTARTVGDLVDAAELDIPQHDGTVAGETAVTVGGGTGASWWTVISRENDAVVLTRVVDPQATVHDDGSTADSIDFRRAVLAQARTSAGALDHFAG
jgi:hypothetical protein